MVKSEVIESDIPGELTVAEYKATKGCPLTSWQRFKLAFTGVFK